MGIQAQPYVHNNLLFISLHNTKMFSLVQNCHATNYFDPHFTLYLQQNLINFNIQQFCFCVLTEILMHDVQCQYSHITPFMHINLHTHIQVYIWTATVVNIHARIYMHKSYIAAINNTHMHLNNKEHPHSASQQFCFVQHGCECECV